MFLSTKNSTLLIQRINKIFFAIILCLSVLAVFSFASSNALYAQSGVCDDTVPYFEADLSAHPNASWVSPPVIREGYCCGNSGVDRCIEFSITLHPDAVAIIFDIASGAVPGGSMYYQINCGPPVEVGEPVCLTGVGPHTLTFCKPGNNDNTYSITSVPEPSFTGLDVATENCYSQITVEGAIDGTVTYEDLTGGGTYLSYLSCTDCSDPLVIPDENFPEYVDYKVCGDAEAEVCMDSLTYCDTIRIYFHDTIAAAISPDPAEYCDYEGGLLLHVDLLSGVPPYNFEWYDDHDSTGNMVSTNQDYFAPSPGPYSVVVYDSLYPQCDPVVLNTDVIEHPQPTVSVDPVNPFICTEDSVTLTASGAETYSWAPAQGLSQTTGESVVASPDVTTTYAMIGTDANGCSDTFNVTVEVCPIPDVQILTSDTDICLGDSVQLEADGALIYEWNPADGLNDPTLQSPTASPSTTTTYYVSGWDVSCNLIQNWNFND
jgi:large repetitive protein